MIPVRLELKNFLPYTSPAPVRFEGVHLACLTGANGAGKSSLLDAITWALWGKARAKRDDDLVHLGQSDMYVQLDFEQEGANYRVLRRRARGKRGQGALDLFVFREDGSPNNISERSIRETQRKIDSLLRLDYDTFVNSAFLQQGKADAFTVKTPAERKKILSEILGLDQWTRYEDAVKERLKGISNNLSYFEQRIDEIDAELARKPALERERDDADTSYQEAQKALQQAEEQRREIEYAPGELVNTQQRKTDLERRQREHQTDLENVSGQIERQREQIAEYQQTIDAREEIESGYNALQSAREANRALSDKLMKLKTLDDERYQLRGQIAAARTRLESDVHNIQQRIEELEASDAADYETELEDVQKQVDELHTREAERDRINEQINTLREENAGIKTQLEAVTGEGKELRDRHDRLEAADADAALCPVCGQPLGSEERAKLLDDLTAKIEEKRETYRQSQERSNDIGTEVKDLQAEVKTIAGDLKQLQSLRERVGVLHNQIDTARQAATRLEEERAALEKAQATLANDDFAADVRQQLAALDDRHSELDYDADDHTETQTQLDAHSQYEGLHARLEVALKTLPGLEANLQDAIARQERLTKASAETQTQLNEIDGEIERLKVLVEEYQTREEEVRKQRTLERSAYERLVNARQSLDALEKQAVRKADLEDKRAAAREEEAIYTDLKQAFGKNGVPAMVIETAIPELETTANDLLSRMTDGRMHLRLTTQREKVTGGTAETLDIEIADELGERSYEMYSGGEAFRINFAIRVALSKMLARRAGAHLRTLFIDEGFGTQDDAGRSKLVEAINAIQDEFDLILVITHIDELRDSFPVHVMVEKTRDGSVIEIR
jgi:DNA repair protein SbcC/Rad50